MRTDATIERRDDGKYTITVSVWSNKKPATKASGSVDPGYASDATSLNQMIAIVAGACAEHCNDHLGDNIDPAEAIREVLASFDQECRILAELSRDFGRKLRQVLALGLTAQERDRVERIAFAVEKGGRPTRGDSELITGLLARHLRRNR